jgi:DNA modification methylase
LGSRGKAGGHPKAAVGESDIGPKPVISLGGYKSVWDLGRAGKANYSVHAIGEYPTKIRPIVVAEIVNRFTRSGDVILDPFCGGGTIAVEAKMQGRSSISYDVSKDAVQLARRRLDALHGEELKRMTAEFLQGAERDYSASRKGFQRIQTKKRVDFYRWKLKDLEDPDSSFLKTTHSVEVGDARRVRPGKGSADAVITDIPYASLIRYSDLKDDLSSIDDYPSFLREMKKAFANTIKALRPGGYYVVFVADFRVGASRRILPVHSDVIQMLKALGMELFDILIWRYYRSGSFRPFGKPPYQAMNVHIYILAFNKPTGNESAFKPNRPPLYRPRLAQKLRMTARKKV